jgi:hypothetical protein
MMQAIYSKKELGDVAEYLMSFQKSLTDEFMEGYSSLKEAIKTNGIPNLANRTYDASSSIVTANSEGEYVSNVESWSSVAFKCERHSYGVMDISFNLSEDHPRAKKYPTAYRLIQEFGDNCSLANYSCMAPNSIIKRHTDPENINGKNVRIHIPLIIPEGDIFLEVNGQEVNWSDCFGFSNQLMHSAFNLTDEYRLVFFLDLTREYVGIDLGEKIELARTIATKPFIRNKNGTSIISPTPKPWELGKVYINKQWS